MTSGPVVYLLHFSQPVNAQRPARHYTGTAFDLDGRLRMHAQGRGARITAACVERGITWQLGHTWPGGRAMERIVKRQHNAPRLCDVCASERQALGVK